MTVDLIVRQFEQIKTIYFNRRDLLAPPGEYYRNACPIVHQKDKKCVEVILGTSIIPVIQLVSIVKFLVEAAASQVKSLLTSQGGMKTVYFAIL